MGRRSIGISFAAAWFLVVALVSFSQPVLAFTACALADTGDPSGDVQRDPADASAADSVTGLNRADITDICLAEDAENMLVTMKVVADISSGPTFSGTYSMVANGTTYAVVHEGGAATGPGEVVANQVQFKLPKTLFPLGVSLPAVSFSTRGVFVPTVGETVTGTDSFAATNLTYTIGSRAPAGADADSDGLDDRDEITNGTNPNNPDTDGDGLNDGAEIDAGTDPLVKDSDGDTVDDGTEVQQGSNPNNRDTDRDGFDDGVDSNPTTPSVDTDGDGLDDDAERNPRNPTYQTRYGGGNPGSTNPNDNDTDDDGISDGDEVNGVRGSPTDPNNADTDGDGVSDLDELQSGTDPADEGERPDTGGGGGDGDVSEAVITYLPISGAAVLIVILICSGGILWRWG